MFRDSHKTYGDAERHLVSQMRMKFRPAFQPKRARHDPGYSEPFRVKRWKKAEEEFDKLNKIANFAVRLPGIPFVLPGPSIYQ